jgi:hypothetical protein
MCVVRNSLQRIRRVGEEQKYVDRAATVFNVKWEIWGKDNLHIICFH